MSASVRYRVGLLVYILLVCMLVPTKECYAAQSTLHAILIADSKDATIGTGAADNNKVLRAWLKESAGALGMAIDLKSLVGSNFSCENIAGAVEAVQVGSDDVVLFYYSGHGFRTEHSSTKFPDFYCGAIKYSKAADQKHKAALAQSANNPSSSPCGSEDADPFCNLHSVAAQLKSKGARLTLAFADTCNVLLPISVVIKPTAAAGPRIPQLKELLLKSRGTLTMSASAPGEYAWYVSTGGLFTTQLTKAIDTMTAPTSTGSWSDVVALASRTITVDADAVPPVTQTPQAENLIVQ